MGSVTGAMFDTPGKQVKSPASLAHIFLNTSNKNRLRDYYLALLGGNVVFENDHLCFIAYDEEHHRIALMENSGLPDKVEKGSCGMGHVAFTYPTLTDLLLSYKQRLEHGLKPVWCVNHGPTTSIYYKDPDGNMAETQVDNFGTADEATTYMKGEGFARNPIGVDFDPEVLIERLRAGDSELVLKVRPKGPGSVVP